MKTQARKFDGTLVQRGRCCNQLGIKACCASLSEACSSDRSECDSEIAKDENELHFLILRSFEKILGMVDKHASDLYNATLFIPQF